MGSFYWSGLASRAVPIPVASNLSSPLLGLACIRVLLMVLHELFGAEADLIYENIELRMRRQRIMPQTRVTDAHGIGW